MQNARFRVRDRRAQCHTASTSRLVDVRGGRQRTVERGGEPLVAKHAESDVKLDVRSYTTLARLQKAAGLSPRQGTYAVLPQQGFIVGVVLWVRYSGLADVTQVAAGMILQVLTDSR